MRSFIISCSTFLVLFSSILCEAWGAGTVRLSEHVSVTSGAVNGVEISAEGKWLVVYGGQAGRADAAEMVLFTHGRRDVIWAGEELVEQGGIAVVPAAEVDKFAGVGQFWDDFSEGRFHDYYQQSTKIAVEPMKVGKAVKGGESFLWNGIRIEVIDTPGYTRGGVSYFMRVDGVKYGFVGDIIYGHGKLLDLYSLQDAVAEAKIRGYHGWAGRMGELISSLRAISRQGADILVPARGPVIHNPSEAIGLLIGRLRAVYENYLSISAGQWYFGEGYDILAKRVLGADGKVNWMGQAETINAKPPEWITSIGNSRLIISKDGAGFLIDGGSKWILSEVVKLKQSGKLTSLEGLFVTHYHDDHTDAVNEFVREFGCGVYTTGAVADILKRPGSYRMPCLTSNAIASFSVMGKGEKMRWKKFELTFHDFPGQTIYHGSVLVEKDDAETIFFIGDSFTPSGIDDYCLLNRNLLGDGLGYLYCLELLGKMPANTLLINQHVGETFRFNRQQISHMIVTLKRRKKLMAELFPWDDANYGIDERWVRFAPYSQSVRAGKTIGVEIEIMNHSPKGRRFEVRLNKAKGFRVLPGVKSIMVEPREVKSLRFEVAVSEDVTAGNYVLTADVRAGEHQLKRWTETMIIVK